MEASPAAPARSRARWLGPLRLVVSVGLLAVLVTKINFATLIPSNRSLPGTLAFLCAGVALMALSMVVAAWRWQRVLVVFDAPVPMRHLIADYFAGQFVGNVLPSTLGGDVVRIARVTKDVGGRDTAFASVVLERLTGFVSLPLLILVGFAVRPDLAGTPNAWIAILTGCGTVVVFTLILVLCGHPALAGRFTHHENWMRYIGAVHVGVDRMRRQPRHAATVLSLAILYQLIVMSAIYCAFHTIGLTVPNAAVIAFVPAVAMAQVLPLSVSGLGIREGMLVLLLHPLGVSTGQAVAVGLLWYAMLLLASLAGAPAFALGSDRRHVPAEQAA